MNKFIIIAILLSLKGICATNESKKEELVSVSSVSSVPLTFEPDFPSSADISETRIEGQTIIAALASALMQNTGTHELVLPSCEIGNKGVSLLAPVIARFTHLHTLNLSDNHIDFMGIQTLSDNIVNLRFIRVLNLRYNLIGLEGAKSLSIVIPNFVELKQLDLGHCGIGDAGLTDIFSKIDTLHMLALETLAFDYNLLTASSMIAFSTIMPILGNLLHLNLSHNPLHDEGILHLSPNLARLTKLHVLRLNQVGITDIGTISLGAPISSLKSLEELHLMENSITDKGSNAIAPYLGSLSLKVLNMQGNRVSSNGLNNLKTHTKLTAATSSPMCCVM